MQRFWQVCKTNKKYILIGIVVAGLGFIYKNLDPAINTYYFPKCPFKYATGYECPGCGSQRATHALLNLEITKAFSLNPLMLIALPYLAIGFVLEKSKLSESGLAFRKTFYGPTAIKVIAVIIIVFGVGRNLI